MSQLAPAERKFDYAPALPRETAGQLLRVLLLLSFPVLAEHMLHILVGLTDTYLSNHMHAYDVQTDLTRADETAAGAAVGTMTYILWFVSMVTSAIATGSTAIIARAVGAKHRSLANSICGQSMSAAVILGSAVGVGMYFFAEPIGRLSGLSDQPLIFAVQYLRILAPAIAFSTAMFVANACLRGAGDTLTPAIAMITVDAVNMFFSAALCYGWVGLPKLGFAGVAWGTTISYVSGGLLQFVVLFAGRGGIRLHIHRMRPHWRNLKRLLRIGLPGGVADLLHFLGNFGVLYMVNHLGAAAGNAHNIAIRIESISFMTGFAVATAAATMVGQSLGMKRPDRAQRSAYLAYALGGGIMFLGGIGFIFFGKYPAMLLSDDPAVRELTTRCIFITGFIQAGFAAALVFGGALRGAGDTMAVLLLSASSVFGVRLLGVWIVTHFLQVGLAGVWMVLAGELFLRGALIFLRFLHGGWKRVTV